MNFIKRIFGFKDDPNKYSENKSYLSNSEESLSTPDIKTIESPQQVDNTQLSEEKK